MKTIIFNTMPMLFNFSCRSNNSSDVPSTREDTYRLEHAYVSSSSLRNEISQLTINIFRFFLCRWEKQETSCNDCLDPVFYNGVLLLSDYYSNRISTFLLLLFLTRWFQLLGWRHELLKINCLKDTIENEFSWRSSWKGCSRSCIPTWWIPSTYPVQVY